VLKPAELAKLLEEKWGVSAAPRGGCRTCRCCCCCCEEKTEFTVVLAAVRQEVEVIKEVRALTGLWAEGSQGLVEGAPSPSRKA